MVNFNPGKKLVVLAAGLLVMALSLSSCDTLKEKFIRKPKHEVQSFTPVLEPEEYPSPELDPKHNYQQHYDLIKAWYRDLWSAIDEKDTSKYVHYIIREVDHHIDQMKALVDEPTRLKLIKLSSYLDYYQSSLEYSWQVRNVSRIQSDLRGFDRYLRDNLRIDRIQGHFIKIMPAAMPAKPAIRTE
ncbi:MAG: hypothetical protein KGK03_02180 [Candidatus Omnitrophica bacterium]|nr:hypothetical protein [Candidatus Omnitrophota bacterium]MDE2221857.1 hypothetical protein [Candidatus Omnitrophota bacterium]